MALTTSTGTAGSSGQAAGGDDIKVMVVEDSAIIRGFIVRMLNEEDGIDACSSVANGKIALDAMKKEEFDVIILDIEMPVMDGLTALPEMMKIDKDVKVIMASTLTSRNAEISLKALQLGAADYVPKPTSAREIGGQSDFRRELVDKVRQLGAARMRRRQLKTGAPVPPGRVNKVDRPAPAPKKALYNKEIILRKAPITGRPEIFAIGSSTGGPQALFTLLKGLPLNPRIPIVITQHMPATFTSILAEHISRMTGWPCKEGADGDVLKGGQIYLAPGDYHMLVENKGTAKVIKLDQGPQENFCRPAVDPMFRSLIKAYGANKIFAAILTGMGSDGLKGGTMLVEAGGTLVAQDEATSVVWGMPGAVATAGICSAVLPIEELAGHIEKALK